MHLPGKKMKETIRLIRLQNLLIVALTMILMRYAVISPLLSMSRVALVDGSFAPMAPLLPLSDFIVLVIATLLVTAAGYVINDYFDIRTDLINRGEVIVGNKIPRRKAMMMHNILNLTGVAAAFWVSYRINNIWMGFLFLIVSGLLYFYSATYKRQFLIGNIIVAILTAMVPMLVIFFEAPLLLQYKTEGPGGIPVINLLFAWVGGFSIFAFLTTLAREIIKDIEDFEGDMAFGRNTLPVVLGIVPSRIIAGSLVALSVALLYLVWFFHLDDYITLVYLTVAIVLPMIIVLVRMVRGNTRADMKAASNLMKFVMLTGIFYSVVACIIISKNLF
jgi:4-hydroxybenzoate polyprenyltransferase